VVGNVARQSAAAKPNPGRTETWRRLNRTEYQNAIRDLLAVDIDASSLLPADESGHGFDNVTVGDLPPTLLDRYISAAQKISALAIGSTQTSLQSDIIRVAPDVTQEEHVAGLPVGTRGGILFPYTFAQNGEYDIQIYLARGYSGDIDGLKDTQPHELKCCSTGCRLESSRFSALPTATTRSRQESEDSRAGDSRSASRRRHVSQGSLFTDRIIAPATSVAVQRARSPRITPGILQVSVTGPYAPHGADNTPSRPGYSSASLPARMTKQVCAKKILSTLTRRAYRRPISEADLERPMAFYREGRSERDFDAGISKALSAVLVNPEFPVPRRSRSREDSAGRRLPHH
jgi:hypothetical protein